MSKRDTVSIRKWCEQLNFEPGTYLPFGIYDHEFDFGGKISLVPRPTSKHQTVAVNRSMGSNWSKSGYPAYEQSNLDKKLDELKKDGLTVVGIQQVLGGVHVTTMAAR